MWEPVDSAMTYSSPRRPSGTAVDGIPTECVVCSGYYAACSHGESICSVCHEFLFPEDGYGPGQTPCITLTEPTEESGDDDSGTEEPMDHDTGPKRAPLRVVVSPKSDAMLNKIRELSQYSKEDEGALQEGLGLAQVLPSEVLLQIFCYLDGLSLCWAGQVCVRWASLLDSTFQKWPWQQFVMTKWPLFSPQVKVHCWRAVFEKLLQTVTCRKCFARSTTECPVSEPIISQGWRNKRLQSEMKSLRHDAPEGIQAAPMDLHLCNWQATISGPVGSPYQGGLFFLQLKIPSSYPMTPPKVRFLTRIFHPNISRHGDIGLDSLYNSWSLALTVPKVLLSIQSLLTDPYCYICMEPEISAMYQHQPRQFEVVARTWTWRYAMVDVFMQPPRALGHGDGEPTTPPHNNHTQEPNTSSPCEYGEEED